MQPLFERMFHGSKFSIETFQVDEPFEIMIIDVSNVRYDSNLPTMLSSCAFEPCTVKIKFGLPLKRVSSCKNYAMHIDSWSLTISIMLVAWVVIRPTILHRNSYMIS